MRYWDSDDTMHYQIHIDKISIYQWLYIYQCNQQYYSFQRERKKFVRVHTLTVDILEPRLKN